MRGKIKTYHMDCREGNRTDTKRGARRTAYVFALFMCSVLYGCTPKEQLVLETESIQQEVRECEEPEVQKGETAMTQEDKSDAGGSVQDSSAMSQKQEPDQVPSTIYVHVCGAVKNPGVYELAAGSRVYEAVEEAGGFTENAESSYVNQAQQLSDGVKLIIPTTEQVEAGSVSDVTGTIGIVESAGTGQAETGQEAIGGAGATPDGVAASDGKININTASEAELCNIPGIGETRAAAIVTYRQEMGGFTSIEDIMNVSGIKQGTYDKIKDRIKVN